MPLRSRGAAGLPRLTSLTAGSGKQSIAAPDTPTASSPQGSRAEPPLGSSMDRSNFMAAGCVRRSCASYPRGTPSLAGGDQGSGDQGQEGVAKGLADLCDSNVKRNSAGVKKRRR